jgi:hypothetical protein
MRSFEQRCRNCGAATAGNELCAPCEQDRLLEQAQLASGERRGMRCTD